MVNVEKLEGVRDFFSDNMPHFPWELDEVTTLGRSCLKILFREGFLLRSKNRVGYSSLKRYCYYAKWAQEKDYLYIKNGSPLLSRDNSLEIELKRVERYIDEAVVEKKLVQFIPFNEGKGLDEKGSKILG